MLPEAVILLPLLLVAAAAADVRQHRIPNALTLGSAILGLMLWGRHEGIEGIATGIAGWAVGAALFLPIYLLRGIGAGDIKLMAAVGTYLGVHHAFWAGIAVALAGGIMAAAVALSQRRLGAAVRDSLLILTGRLPAAKVGSTTAPHQTIPYGLAIAGGTMFYMLLRFAA